MKKILIVLLILSAFTVAAKPGFQVSLSKSSEIGFLKVQDTKSTMLVNSYGLKTGILFKDYYQVHAFGAFQYQTEVRCRNLFSSIGNVPGFSFGLGFGCDFGIFGCDLDAGVRAFAENSNSNNYYALVLIGVEPRILVVNSQQFDVRLSMPVSYSISGLACETSLGFSVSASYSYRRAE